MAYFGSVTYPCIPCSKYVKWYLIWCRYIGRPHLGMRFEAIKLLEPSHVDMLCRMYNIDDGLVVREVYNAFLKVLFFPCAYGIIIWQLNLRCPKDLMLRNVESKKVILLNVLRENAFLPQFRWVY